jgi:hypothetical protein
VKDTKPTLADAGIDKKLSSRTQQLAAVPEKKSTRCVWLIWRAYESVFKRVARTSRLLFT